MARQSSMAAAFERIGGVNALPVILMVVSLPLVGSFSSWVTLTVAGLAMGMMIFLMASGLSLVFGLMDVLNFGHSAFISFGAFIAATVLAALAAWVGADSLTLNFLALFAALGAATLFGLAAGWFFERVIVKPVYSDPLRQILITIGALIVAEQIILALWGGSPMPVPRPALLEGSFVIGDIAIETYLAESTVLRVLKLTEARPDTDRRLETALARLVFFRAADRVRQESTEVLPALLDGPPLTAALDKVVAWLPTPVGLIETRALIARSLVARQGLLS